MFTISSFTRMPLWLTSCRASARVAAGDPHTRLPVEGDDELSRLAGRFNDMLDRLEAKDRRLKAQLDELLAERDRLASKNDQAKSRVEDMIVRLKRLEDEA